MEQYNTIIQSEIEELVEKKSKFIANIFHVESIEQADEKIKLIKKKYYDAKHNCIAYRIIEKGQILEKSSDDGEPSGTAGGPMLNILQKQNLCNIVIIVTRYFGGILLGTGGLVRAYSDATQKVIQKSEIYHLVEGTEIKITTDYTNLETLKHYFKKNDINITDVQYSEKIILKVILEKNRKDILIEEIKEKMQNTIKIDILEDKYIEKN